MPKLRIVGQLDFQYAQLKNAFNKKNPKEMSEIRPIKILFEHSHISAHNFKIVVLLTTEHRSKHNPL